MQPKLQGDTFYLPTSDGIYLRNNRQTLTLKGQDIYQWVTALEPYFDGQYTLEAIVNDLEPAQQTMVQDIVETLLEHGFLKDCSKELPHTLNERERTIYAAEIAFIDSFRESAAATFEHFRAQRVLIIGSGLTALALAHATLQAGTRDTTIWITDECETPVSRLQAYRQQAQGRDPRQVLVEQPAPDWHDQARLREVLQPFNVIFHLSDRPMVQRALTLNSLCAALQKPLFQALILDSQALIGPVVTSEPGCWECAWRRRLANLDVIEQDPWQNDLTSPVSSLLSLPTAAAVANLLSFECFKYLTQAGSCELHGKALQLDLETLRCQSHTFLPHPLCQTCQLPSPLTEVAFLENIHALQAQEPLEEETFDQQIFTCFDASLGIFSYIGEADLVQMPLNASSLTISAPMNLEQPQNMATLTQAYLGRDTTRRLLTLQGCALYAAHLVDRRRLIKNASGTWAWAHDLYASRARLIPAALAFLSADSPQDSLSTPGISAGFSWAEACSRALLDHALALTLQEVHLREARYGKVALNPPDLDAQGRYLLTLVEQAGVSLSIYNIPNTLQVPMLAFCIENETLAYTTHFDALQALNDGLKQVVQHLQARVENQPLYALPAVPQLDSVMCDDPGTLPEGPNLSTWPERVDWLSEKFHLQHWRVLALPLDHDPALSALIPFLVRVLLVREEE